MLVLIILQHLTMLVKIFSLQIKNICMILFFFDNNRVVVRQRGNLVFPLALKLLIVRPALGGVVADKNPVVQPETAEIRHYLLRLVVSLNVRNISRDNMCARTAADISNARFNVSYDFAVKIMTADSIKRLAGVAAADKKHINVKIIKSVGVLVVKDGNIFF